MFVCLCFSPLLLTVGRDGTNLEHWQSSFIDFSHSSAPLGRNEEEYDFGFDEEPSPSPQGYGGTPNPQTPGYPDVPSPQVNPQYNPQTPGTPAM